MVGYNNASKIFIKVLIAAFLYGLPEDVPHNNTRRLLAKPPEAAIRKVVWQTELQLGARTSPLAGTAEGQKFGLLGLALVASGNRNARERWATCYTVHCTLLYTRTFDTGIFRRVVSISANQR